MNSTLPAAPHVDDQRHRRAVLAFLLTTHPAVLTTDEVLRAVAADDSFAEHDAIGRAVHDLGSAGLVHRLERFVLLTQAAVQTAALLDDP